MNRHLNVFVPYQLASTHEDQLTRAAMIVLRAVPLARDAFLALLNCRRSGELPEPEFECRPATSSPLRVMWTKQRH